MDFNIPVGINSGQQLRVAGKGERGVNGGPNGDLFLEIIVSPHQYFTRDGNDIHIEIPLDFIDAILGVKIDVPTVYGDCEVEIPAGTQPNQIIRLKGRGVKDLRKGTPGDEYVHIKLQTPTKISKEQRKLLEEYKKSETKGESFFEKFKKAFKK